MATGDERAALAALNAGTPAECAWSAAVLLSGLCGAVDLLARNDRDLSGRVLLAMANDSEDAVYDQVAIVLDEAMRREGLIND